MILSIHQARALFIAGALLEKECLRAIKDSERGKIHYLKNRERILAHQKEKRESDPAFAARAYKRSREWLAARPGRALAQQTAWKMNNTRKWKIGNMWASARIRARNKGMEFNITKQDIDEILGESCPVFGVPYAWIPKEKGSKSDWSVSLDRIDNSKGYIRGNVVVVSELVNRIKNTATADQLMRIAMFYKRMEDGVCVE